MNILTTRTYFAYSFSLLLHLTIFYIAVLIEDAFLNMVSPLADNKMTFLEASLELEDLFLTFKKGEKKPTGLFVATEEPQDALGAKPGEQNANNSSSVQQDPKELQKYGQILAQHFANVMPAIDFHPDKPVVINIQIKVSKFGKIMSYIFNPEPNAELKDALIQGINRADPVPIPPMSGSNKEFTQYIIPVIFK